MYLVSYERELNFLHVDIYFDRCDVIFIQIMGQKHAFLTFSPKYEIIENCYLCI